MSGDHLPLDAIEESRGGLVPSETVLALVAEVRRLRAQVERVEAVLDHTGYHPAKDALYAALDGPA